MSLLEGIAASSGIAIAKAYRLVEPDLSFSKTTIEDVAEETARFQSAIAISVSELESIQQLQKKNWVLKMQQFSVHIF